MKEHMVSFKVKRVRRILKPQSRKPQGQTIPLSMVTQRERLRLPQQIRKLP